MPVAYSSGLVGMNFSAGMIIMWTGVTAPSGWTLCDGTNGSPDLRDRFIVCKGNNYALGTIGGQILHSHQFLSSQTTDVGYAADTDGGHTHGSGATGANGSDFNAVTSGDNGYASLSDSGHWHGLSGVTSDQNSNIPPYYTLAFIMKV